MNSAKKINLLLPKSFFPSRRELYVSLMEKRVKGQLSPSEYEEMNATLKVHQTGKRNMAIRTVNRHYNELLQTLFPSAVIAKQSDKSNKNKKNSNSSRSSTNNNNLNNVSDQLPTIISNTCSSGCNYDHNNSGDSDYWDDIFCSPSMRNLMNYYFDLTAADEAAEQRTTTTMMTTKEEPMKLQEEDNEQEREIEADEEERETAEKQKEVVEGNGDGNNIHVNNISMSTSDGRTNILLPGPAILSLPLSQVTASVLKTL
jgi:hypothetical protein